jgi:hypothetical protein
MKGLFDVTKIMFEYPEKWNDVTAGEKKKYYFQIQRRMAIKFPLQANVLQHLKIDAVSVIDFWYCFLGKQFNRTPYWMYTKGVKKAKETKEKKINIKESLIKEYAIKNNFDIRSVKDALEFFPGEMKKELKIFQKIIK